MSVRVSVPRGRVVPTHDHRDGHAHSHDVDHGHEHGHEHGSDGDGHTHGAVTERAPLGGPVVMDIGGDIGALVLRLDDSLEGTELPIEFEEEPLRDIHTGVWRRPLGAGTVVVAVYPELRAGNYRIHPTAGQDGASVSIVGGEVAQLDLRRLRED